jgi:hypothetical protein
VLKDKTTLIVLFTLALTLYQYYKIPIKDVRYIFPLVMPISYFSVIATTKIRKKSKIVFKLLVVSVIILNLTTSTIILIYNVLQNESQERYLAAVEVMEDLGIINCRLFTNEWPRINYVGKTAENYPRENMVQNEIDNGNFILMFKSPKEPIWLKDESFVKQLPTVYENKDFVLFGNLEKCNPEEKPNYTYLQLLNRYMEFTYNETINTEPCFVIFENHRVLEKFCNLVNMRGFVSDGNRNFA